MARTYQFVVGPREAKWRLDRYLVRHLPQSLSRAAVQRAIRQGAVLVEGQAAKAHRPLQVGERIVATLTELPSPSRDAWLAPEPIPLAIVYEDEQVLVVNKPPGLVTHPAPGHWTGTLVNAVLWHLRDKTQQAWDRGQGTGDKKGMETDMSHGPRPTSHLPRAGIVHRLDKDTSGLLLIAKTDVALRELAKQLKTRTMRRRYLALVEGHLGADHGTIDAAIGRHLRRRKEMTVRYLGGRKAVTHYRVLKRLKGEGTSSLPSPLPFPYTLLELSLETGRTHQIRVHLAHWGHPVLGDVVYGRHSAGDWHMLGISRQLLHAHGLRFLHPTRRQSIELTAELPPDMVCWLGENAGQ